MKLLIVIALINLGSYLGISMAPVAGGGIARPDEVVVDFAERPAPAGDPIVALNQNPVAAPRAEATVAETGDTDEEVWSQTYSSPDLDSDPIALDADGDLLLRGSAFVVGENLDVRVSKYGRDGAVVWTKSFTDSPSGSDEAYTVAIDEEGNVLGTAYEEEDYW